MLSISVSYVGCLSIYLSCRELIRVGLFDIIAEVLMSSDKKLVLMGYIILPLATYI